MTRSLFLLVMLAALSGVLWLAYSKGLVLPGPWRFGVPWSKHWPLLHRDDNPTFFWLMVGLNWVGWGAALVLFLFSVFGVL